MQENVSNSITIPADFEMCADTPYGILVNGVSVTNTLLTGKVIVPDGATLQLVGKPNFNYWVNGEIYSPNTIYTNTSCKPLEISIIQLKPKLSNLQSNVALVQY